MNLIDSHGRQIKKLRVSLTDKCNLRCHYCMPIHQTFMSEEKYLSPFEIFEIVRELKTHGLEEVRLTGGEPLMRKSFAEIANLLGSLFLKKLSLTTNGILLEKHFDVLIDAKITHLNISLDSLNREAFKKITFGDHLNRVLANIVSAKERGFLVKLNVVAMKGINDHEVLDFIVFSQRYGIEVRFLELMRIGHARNDQRQQFFSAAELISKINKTHELTPVPVPNDSTSFNFRTDTGARIGFIASESQPFCGQCSRWRLSADGMMRACLLKDDGISFKNLSSEQRLTRYQDLLGMKPNLRPAEVNHQMNSIGG